MNTNTTNPKSQTQILTIIWLVFLMNTVTFPVISYISNRSDLDASSGGINAYISIGMGIGFFLLSHLAFKSVSGRPIMYQKYIIPFIISLAVSETITLLGFVLATTNNFDVFTYSLFALGFLSVLIKKPNTNMIATAAHN